MSTKLTTKTIVALASMMLACFASFASQSGYRATFTVTGYSGSTTLENFPVLVRLAAGSPVGFSYTDCAADGSDLRFTDMADNPIPHEIETWDTTGESLVWVKLPTMSAGTQFVMWYGGSAAANTPAGTWSAYTGVWHMDEASGAVADATGHGLAATPMGNTENSVAVAGAVGNGRQTATSAAKGYLSVPNYDSFDLGGTFTMSGWVKMSACTAYPRMFSRKANYTDANGWEIEMKNGSMVNFTARGSGNSSNVDKTFSTTLQDAWSHLAFVYSDATLTVYQNGSQVASGAIGAATDNGLALSFGCDSDGSETYLQGAFDECRLMGGAASADWVKAEYDTASSASFLTVGASEPTVYPALSASVTKLGVDGFTADVTIGSVGSGASSCDLYLAYAPSGDPLPAYERVATGLASGGTFSRNVTGLPDGAEYAWSFMASNDLGRTVFRTGTFTIGAGYLNPARFTYRATFTVTGYTGAEVLENFPVLVRLAADSPRAFDYADCTAGGADIRFADAEGKLIPHEIETWNTAGESLVWVGLPIATNGASFTMFYHAPDPGVTAAGSVWARYAVVIHGGDSLANAVAGGVAVIAGSDAVSATAGSGVVGGGVNKSTANAKGLNVGNPAKAGVLADNNEFSLSAWFKRTGSGTAILAGSRTSWNSQPGFLWLQEKSERISVAANNAHQLTTNNQKLLSTDSWTHLAFTVNDTVELKSYFDGAPDQTKTSPATLLNTSNDYWTFGSYCDTATSDSYSGDMDELRIFDGVASGDWIQAEHDTVASTTFLTAGPSSACVNPQLSTSSLLADRDAVNVTATIDAPGGDAASCDLYFAYALSGDPLPAWTLVASGLSAGDTRTRNLTGLVEDVDYDYAFLASNTLGRTSVKTGTFLTGIGFKRPDPDVAEFSRGVKFTVTGYTGTQELTNFPVLVRLSNNSPSGFSYADFYNPGDVQGADLCFLDAAGNGIPHEIDTWNPNGESLVWVTLPRMVNGTEFAMWYRSSKNGSVICDDNAWEDYTGVWHLGEGGDGVQSVYDSTTNDLTGVTHANSLAVAAGRIGAARRNSTKSGNSAANGRILVDLSDSAKRAAVDALAAEDSDKTFTASLWMCPRSGTDYSYMISRKEDDYYPSWGVQYNNKDTEYFTKMRVYSSGNHYNQSKEFTVQGTSQNTWRKIDVVWSGTKFTVYYDGGAKVYTDTLYNSLTAANGSSDLSFGGCTAAGYGSFNGELDEIRLRKGANSADWVKAEYDAVVNATFLNGGEVVALAETPRPIATLSLADSGAKYVQFHGSIGNCGGDATACEFYAKVWKTADAEPDSWTNLVSGIAQGSAFFAEVTGLDPETAYSYKLKAVNNLETPIDSEIAEGTFMTGGTGSGGTGGERYRVGNDYVHVFEIEQGSDVTTFEFTPPDYVSSIRALVVAGGGPGGYRRGGGGGAGGLIYDAALAVTGGETYTINVGTGGVASASESAYGSNGGDSSIVGTGVSVTATGGGAGGNYATKTTGVAGGSGGGGGGAGKSYTAGGAGVDGRGNSGGNSGFNNSNYVAGGGGGAGRVGGSGANDAPPSGGSGGQGFLTDISGTPTWYAGGGGGGGMQGGTASNLSSPGGGGDGGGGRGGMAVPNGTVNPSFGPAAVAGQNGLGGGGGGGSDVSGFYEGANGGNGIVIVRYTVEGTGAGSAEPVVSLTGATYAGDLKITGTYRMAWAGEGKDNADVYIKWGYSANSLTHSTRVAQDAIGTGTFEITVPVDQTTIYLRAMADNGTAQGLSDEIVPIYIPEYSGVVPGDPTIPVLGTVSLSEVDGLFARVSGTVTSFGTAGAGEDPITNCVVYALVGTSDNVSRMTAQDEMFVTAGEPFSLAISNLNVNTTYYWCLEARNSAGVAVATQVGSFTTLPEHTVANSINASGAQRTINLSGSLAQIGAGKTVVSVRWKEGGDEWGDWSVVTNFDGTSASTAFNTSHTSESWNTTIAWQVSFSNQCVTAEGEPVGDPWVTTQSGNFTTGDNATYTWQPVDGDWNGAWDDSAHWRCSSDDGRGFPQSGSATASFADCTLANPVTVSVPTAHTIGTLQFFGENPVSLTFVGQGASTSRITATTLQENAAKSDSVLEFRDMTVGRVNDNFWTVAPTDSSRTNLTLRFSGTTLQNVSSFVFAAPYSTVEFLNGSTATFSSKMSIGGTNTVVTIDDSVVNAKSIYIPADADGPGMKVRLRGTNPLLKQNHVDGDFSSWAQSWPVVYEFQVPQGGFASAPLQHISTAHRLGQLNQDDQSGATPTFSFSVAADSPALTAPGTISNNVLVDTVSGFYTDFMSNPIGTLPVGATGAVKYGVSGAATDDTSAARQILLDLKGTAPRTMIIIW